MGYGISIKNDVLKTIIDDSSPNLVLYESGTLTLVYSAGGGSGGGNILLGAHTFSTATSKPPLIAIKPRSDYQIGLRRYIKSGSNYTGFELGGQVTALANITVDWAAFIPVSGYKSSEAYGLRVYDATEEPVYDSGRKSIKILDVLSSSILDYENEDLTHPSGTHYFAAAPHGLMQRVVQFIAPATWWTHRIAGFKYVDSTTVNFGETDFQVNVIGSDVRSYFPFGYWPAAWKILVIKDPT